MESQWGAEEKEAFEKLKESITIESTMAYFNPPKPNIICISVMLKGIVWFLYVIVLRAPIGNGQLFAPEGATLSGVS